MSTTITAAEQSLAVNIRDIREGLQWTQADLAIKMNDSGLGCYPQTVQKIEAGERRVSAIELYSVAKIFGVEMSQLIGSTGSSETLAVRLKRAIDAVLGSDDDA